MKPLPFLLFLVACTDQALTRFDADPEATILSPTEGASVVEGQHVAARGSASDADDGAVQLRATWYADDTVVCDAAAPDDEGLTGCDWTATAETKALRLEVMDPEGEVDVATAALTVRPNEPPSAAFVSPVETGRYYDGSLVEFDSLVDDPEGGPTGVTVAFTSSLDGALVLPATAEADGHARGATTLSRGEHYLTVTATDGYGKSAADTVIITVGEPNTPPTCAITAPVDGTIGRERDEVGLEGTAADADVSADQLSATWSSDRDGALGTVVPTTDGTISLATAALSAGTHVLTLTVTDDARATCVSSVHYTVLGAPVVAITAPTEGEVLLDDGFVTFDGTATDPESLPTDLVVEWSSDADGVLWSDSPDSAGRTTFSTDALTPGPHRLTLRATDPDGQWTVQTVDVTVDAVPTAPVVALGPTGARTDDDLVATITSPATDAEGDPLTYSYTWFVDGIASAASTSATLPASATSRGETWTVEVRADDGYGDGPAGSAALIVANTAPELTAATIDPSAPLTDDVLSLSTTTSDADGDAVTLGVVWYVGAGKAGTRATLDGAVNFSKGDEVFAVVTPTDGTDDGTSVRSSAVVIGNTAPGAATVAITPSAPQEGVEDLVCTVAANDADADALTWTIDWTVDGVAYAGATTTVEGGDSVPASETDEGEVWACTATPSDGSASGTSGSSSVTVSACVYGHAGACAAASCNDVLAAGTSTGDGRYSIDPDGAGAVEVWCDMSTDGGGWTLVAVASDDGADTWTYARRRYWDLDTTAFGSLDTLDHDYKSAALHRLPATDLLLVHAPSAVWAEYDAVGSGTDPLADILAGYGDETCWKEGKGVTMTAGGLSATGSLCDTDLYLNAADKDGGGSCTCANCTEDAYGPTFSVDQGDGCPLDDPGTGGSLGPESGSAAESQAIGFGDALGLNTGASGAGENYMRVYVR